MKTIRKGVFETNSSSTHSLTICSAEEYEKWQKGEVLFSWKNEFVTKEEAVEEIKQCDYVENKEDIKNELKTDWYTAEDYFDEYELDTFEERYTTKSGDEVVAFGKYGGMY